MPYITSADRVKETTTTTGTGTIALAGAVSQFRAFSAVCANNDTIPYAIVGQSGTEWEVGIGTWTTGNNLARTTVLSSSNAGAAVSFSAGTKDVFCTVPSERFDHIRPAAGQASAGGAPLKFTAGVNLTAAEAGAMEFDGKTFYLTTVARAVNAAFHLMSNTADFNGGNVNTAQPFFEAANDTITLEANTTYLFEGVIEMTRAAGTTSHFIDVLFGGTVGVGDVSWHCHCRDGALSTTTPLRCYTNHFHALAGGSVTVAATTANSTFFLIKGMLRTSTSGTLIPQFKYSAAPGGAPVIKKSSYFTFIPVGADTVGSVGPVA